MYNGKKNLIPLNKRPKEEALAIRRKGQKAATKARRIKRLFIDTVPHIYISKQYVVVF